MSCASIKFLLADKRLRARGFSFLEMLIAVSILSVFLVGIYTIYIRVLQANQAATVRLEALRNGRAALQSLSDEIKTLSALGSNGLLISLDVPPKAYGDGIDNDGDGLIDEEIVDGLDDDTGGGPIDPADDLHAILDPAANLRERPLRVGVADSGDATVDEDIRFGRDFMIYQVIPEIPTNAPVKTITYAVPVETQDLIDGEPDVLVRQTNIDATDPGNPYPTVPAVGVAPIAFNVLGFDLLFWDSNAPPAQQRWVTSWDSTQLAGEKFKLPAAILIRLTLNADQRPREAIADGAPRQTVTLQTVVNIESVIGSPLYERPILP